MKVLVVGNKDDQEEVKRIVDFQNSVGNIEITIVSEKEFEEINKKRDELINKKHDEFLTKIEFGKDWPEPIQEYGNQRNRHERRKLAAESRRK